MARRPILTDYFPEVGRSLLSVGGKDLVDRIGADAVRQVVYAVLCGENLRSETELLTRRRLAITNGAMLMMYLRACNEVEGFLERLPFLAAETLRRGGLSKDERWILNWLLGLTEKAIQNVLRDDASGIEAYLQTYNETIAQSAAKLEAELGPLGGALNIGGVGATVGWPFMVSLLGAVGSQTLTIRGSEKSTYGKLFERLILGSLLHILGFREIDPGVGSRDFEKVFWLSERKDKRESDATAIFRPGQGVRFDIGFIGRGNTEISLDKVSRFEREMEYGRRSHVMATYIIVDRVGRGSRIFDLARRIDGTVVQMSMSYWPKIVATQMGTDLGLEHPLQSMPDGEIEEYLRRKIAEVPIEAFMPSDWEGGEEEGEND